MGSYLKKKAKSVTFYSLNRGLRDYHDYRVVFINFSIHYI